MVDLGDSKESANPRAASDSSDLCCLLSSHRYLHSRSPQNLEYLVFSAASSSTTSKRLPVELNACTAPKKAKRSNERTALIFGDCEREQQRRSSTRQPRIGRTTWNLELRACQDHIALLVLPSLAPCPRVQSVSIRRADSVSSACRCRCRPVLDFEADLIPFVPFTPFYPRSDLCRARQPST